MCNLVKYRFICEDTIEGYCHLQKLFLLQTIVQSMASIPALSSLLITLPRAFHDLAVVGQNLTLPSNNLAFCLANASRFIR